MDDHHMIRKVEKEGQCIYCNETLDAQKWESEFAPRNHYKCVICKCGKENCVKVDFVGTGHDNWSGLEKKVKASRHVKIIESSTKILR